MHHTSSEKSYGPLTISAQGKITSVAHVGQGHQVKGMFRINLVVLERPMLYTKF